MKLFTDSSANLPVELIKKYDIGVVPLTLSVGGEEIVCSDPDGSFDVQAFYDRLRVPPVPELKTSMANDAAFFAAFEPFAAKGEDIVYVGMSSGISGTYQAGFRAALEIRDSYPACRIYTVDTLAASLGEGIMVIKAAQLRESGMDAAEIAATIEAGRRYMRQIFLVDDLDFLHRGGRISGIAALAGSLLNIKPLLKGNDEGEIVLENKTVGRRRAMGLLVDTVAKYEIIDPYEGLVGIAHGGCPDDAETVAAQLRERYGIKEILTVCYEPGTGAHVGPGTIAVFFWGSTPTRIKKTLLVTAGDKIAEGIGAVKDEIKQRLGR